MLEWKQILKSNERFQESFSLRNFCNILDGSFGAAHGVK